MKMVIAAGFAVHRWTFLMKSRFPFYAEFMQLWLKLC